MFAGTGREGGTLAPVRHHVLRSPNLCYTQSGYACYVPRMAAAAYNAGSPYPNRLCRRPAGPLTTSATSSRMRGDLGQGAACLQPRRLLRPCGRRPAMRRGTRLIVVDPRVTWLASRADIHLQLRAGTDTALAMAMLNAIIQEDLYDHDFVEYWCYGFEQLAERVAEMPAEKAGEICGVDPDYINAAARMYANAKPASIAVGPCVRPEDRTACRRPGDGICLMAITANLDVPGGQILGSRARARTNRASASKGGRRGPAEEDDRPGGVSRLLQHHPQRPCRPHAPGVGDGRPLSHQDGLLRRQQPDELHVHGAEALARRHGEVAGVLLHASTAS
ncbi:MAG: molybdopterin-dependent oxidoreductase [Gordonibacter pamelaeae]